MSFKITLKYDPTWDALAYAKQYLPSYITNDIHKIAEYDTEIFLADYTKIDYFFSEEKDAVLFSLKYK